MPLSLSQQRQTFITAAIHLVATNGLQNTTTKLLSRETGINEAILYRCFDNKEALLRETFSALDHELITFMQSKLQQLKQEDSVVEVTLHLLFHDFWKYVLGDREKCLFFIRYYYSAYFTDYSLRKRREDYSAFIESITPAFREGTDVWEEINHLYDIVFPNVQRVLRGELPDNTETEDRVYRFILRTSGGQMLLDQRVAT